MEASGRMGEEKQLTLRSSAVRSFMAPSWLLECGESALVRAGGGLSNTGSQRVPPGVLLFFTEQRWREEERGVTRLRLLLLLLRRGFYPCGDGA